MIEILIQLRVVVIGVVAELYIDGQALPRQMANFVEQNDTCHYISGE